METKKTIIHEGELNLAGLSIPCFVLEDGTRVLSGRGVQEALRIRDRQEGEKRGGYILPTFFEANALKPFIDSKLEVANLEPIICYRGNQKIHGYEATILADLCDAVLEARKSGVKLTARQAIVADQCEILMRAFAKVGIVALVDEATGYQYDRERFELSKILNAYISEEILKWQLTFTDEFYKEVYRLWHLPFIPKYIKNKPSFIGKLTTKYIYEQLPKGVIEKIKDNTRKTEKGNWRYKWHQSLTPEIGREHLKKQIIEVTTLMSVAQSKEQFNSLFRQKYNKEPIQLELEFNEEPEKPKQLSSFNQKLAKAISFDPKENK